MNIEVEVSLYPLTEEFLDHPVQDFVDVLEKHGCAHLLQRAMHSRASLAD